MSDAASGSTDAWLACCATAARPRAAQTDFMKPLTRWALRTVALWAIAKALEVANQKLRQRQQDRKLRKLAGKAAALPRTQSMSSDVSALH